MVVRMKTTILRRSLALVLALLSACAPSPPPPPTLRALYGLPAPTSFVAPRTALVLVDYQREFVTGRLPVPDAKAAIAKADALVRWARAQRMQIVFVRNEALRADSPVFAPGSATTAFAEGLAPSDGDWVVTKHQAGAFTKTDLDARLRAAGVDTLLVAGIMTHLAVDSTARDGTVLGYRVVVAGDACATRALPGVAGGVVPAAKVHAVALASLSDRFADVMNVDAITKTPVQF